MSRRRFIDRPGSSSAAVRARPMRRARSGAVDAVVEIHSMTPARSSTTPQILMVDPDPWVVALARLALAKEGIQVTAATSGSEALATFDGRHGRQVRVVVLDVMLPDVSGWELLRRIRDRSDVPVMVLTRRDSDIDKARGLDLGADDYLTKPFSFLELEARVRALLRRSRRAPRRSVGEARDLGPDQRRTLPPSVA